MTERILYDRVGGMAYFETLVDSFYAGVESDPVLLAVYPDHADWSLAPATADAVPRPVLGRPHDLTITERASRDYLRHAPFAIAGAWRARPPARAYARVDRRIGRPRRCSRRACMPT